MKPETRFWQRVRPGLVAALPAPVHVQRLEPGSAAPGVPDVNICAAGNEIWVENKLVSRGRKVSTLTPGQVAWLTRRAKCGGRVWVLCLHAPTDAILLWPGSQAAQLLERGTSLSPSLLLAPPWDYESLARTMLA